MINPTDIVFQQVTVKTLEGGWGGACILFIVSLNELNFYMNIFTGLF